MESEFCCCLNGLVWGRWVCIPKTLPCLKFEIRTVNVKVNPGQVLLMINYWISSEKSLFRRGTEITWLDPV